MRPISTYHFRAPKEVVTIANERKATQDHTHTESLVISLCNLSFSRLVRKQGRKEIGNEEMKEGRKERRKGKRGSFT